ncbi:hypothetical protein EG68_04532 [Paragonimus skrjabini miyazakii]|uniref:VWFA domain-containing protein n=1 Tax=Paragonimus skrjabini miyazakii TaxID=59628 RepID=A0A8S9Z5L6_9TREM|nr:hypothetical protein EG68_04532 [Paragonimus skrjabini miyazakii]
MREILSRLKCTWTILFLEIALWIIPLNSGSTETMDKTFETWATNLEISLLKLQSLTGEEYLNSVYQRSSYGKRDMTEEVAKEFVDKAMKKLDQIVKQKSELVHNIKRRAEEAYRTRSSDKLTGCYYRAKAITLFPPLLTVNSTQNCSEKQFLDVERNALFEDKYVSLNRSVAHVPTNVYDLSNATISVGNWTASLDSVFKENFAADPSLKWQYFGSSTGFLKYYPGAMWDIQYDENRLDFFDCRSQPWYLSASSYTKEMLILVDKSGSMKGRSDIISNATVAEILNTLTENDFFNIIMFSDTPKYADPEVEDRLLQAFKFNKDRMIKKFQDFTPNGTASYERALNEAFTLLNKTREQRPNAQHCNRALMIITDSVPASYQELFDQYNPEKDVRVFVYLLGQHSSAEPYVEELACYNRGYAVTIATLADVKENVLKYLDIVARSNALKSHGFTIWSGVTVRQFNIKDLKSQNLTNRYTATYPIRNFIPGIYPPVEFKTVVEHIDTMIASKEEEPVMYTSVAEAVYDETKRAKRLQQGILLGVAGIDVPIQSFRDALRGWEIGVNNYLFAHKSILKSYYQNVDLNEVEIPQDVKIDPYTATPDYNTPLRNSMIAREQKVLELQTQIVTDNFHTMFPAMLKYFSNPLNNTPFTVGLAVHWNPETNTGYPIPAYPDAKSTESLKLTRRDMAVFAPIYGEDSEACTAILNHTTEGATTSPYQFCQFNQKLASEYLQNPICVLREVLLNSNLRQAHKCDQEYIDRIYLDAKETQGIFDVWKQKSSAALINEWAIQQAFSFHHTGLIRYYNFSPPAYVNFITDHINGVEDPLYTETVLTTQYFKYKKVAVFHPPPNDLFRQYSSQHYNIPIPMTMVVSRDAEQVPMAVVGLQLTHHHLQSTFDRITNTCLSEPCEAWSGLHVKRYLISQAALVLASTGGEKEIGQNLKEINCALVENMVNHSIIKQYYVYDFQGICIDTSKTTPSFGLRLLTPFAGIFKLLKKIIYELVIISFNLFQPMNPLPILGQHSSWQGNVKSDEIQSNPPDQYGSSRSEKLRNGYYDPYGYKSLPEALAVAELELHNTVRTVDEETGSDLQMPPLPPLIDEATGLKNLNFSDTSSMSNVTLEPELMEEPSDEIFGKMDQDPYEAQLRALAAIEACRQEQSALLQPHFEQDLESNFTESNNTHEADAVSSRMPIPGSLLDCVQKSVQQRCRLGSGTSSFTGRYACEAVCELIRERMPQLVNKLEDCKQPLIACTERFTVFHVLPRPPEDTSNSFGKNADIASYTGEYCQECGTRRWWLRPILGTNLFLLVDYSVPGTSSGPCGCNCQKRFRYGVQITTDPKQPRPNKPRRDPPVPEKCSMVATSMENSTICTDRTNIHHWSTGLNLIGLIIGQTIHYMTRPY